MLWVALLGAAAFAIIKLSSRPAGVGPESNFKASYTSAAANAESASPITRLTFESAQLVRDFPAKLEHPNKKEIYDLACGLEATQSGSVTFTRWAEMALPAEIPHAPKLEIRPDIFTYPEPATGAMEWHLNFADPNLFFGYGGGLFAQDEIQVAEHPALASLREALLSKRCEFSPESRGRPSPILITGVERRCSIALADLYGMRFQRADRATVLAAVHVLRPPTRSNILAMVAPRGGAGTYSRADIEQVLQTAYTGFRAARIESGALKTTIHTGFWGCGAYGGNREMMAMLQIFAARLAHVDRVVFHAFDDRGVAHVSRAAEDLEKIAADGSDRKVPDVVSAIEMLKLTWGTSDGN